MPKPYLIRASVVYRWLSLTLREAVDKLPAKTGHFCRVVPIYRVELIADQLKDTPEKSNRQIADGLGVSPKTVGSIRDELETTVQIGQLKKTIGKDGKARRKPMKSAFIPEADNMAKKEKKEEREQNGRQTGLNNFGIFSLYGLYIR